MITTSQIQVDIPKLINDTDLADLCNITEQAINAGGGFGCSSWGMARKQTTTTIAITAAPPK